MGRSLAGRWTYESAVSGGTRRSDVAPDLRAWEAQ